MNTTKKLMILLAAVAIVGIFVALLQLNNNDEAMDQSLEQTLETSEPGEAPMPDGQQLIIGESRSPTTIVEYGDYKCPNCARFHTEHYPELKQQYIDTGQAKIIFRNLPYIADDSRVAAEGAYCANDQDLFAHYHQAVYDHMSDLYSREGTGKEYENILTQEFLSNIITNAGGKAQDFADCLEGGKYVDQVDNDIALARRDQASGTPTFLISGQKIVGSQSIEIFRPLLEQN